MQDLEEQQRLAQAAERCREQEASRDRFYRALLNRGRVERQTTPLNPSAAPLPAAASAAVAVSVPPIRRKKNKSARKAAQQQKMQQAALA